VKCFRTKETLVDRAMSFSLSFRGRECLEWLTNYKVFHILSSTLESLFSKNMKRFTCAICFYVLITLLYHNSLVSRTLFQLPEVNFRGTLKGRYPDALEEKNHQRQITFRGNEGLIEGNKAITLQCEWKQTQNSLHVVHKQGSFDFRGGVNISDTAVPFH